MISAQAEHDVERDALDVKKAAAEVLRRDFADRKLEVDDVTDALAYVAQAWLDDLQVSARTLEFLVDLKRKTSGGKKLSQAQAKGVLNCWRAELVRKPRERSNVDVSKLDSGYYAVEHDNRVRFVRIDKIDDEDSRWHGWTFVKTQHGDNFERAGAARPGEGFTGAATALVLKILDEPLAAMQRYGQEIGRCGVCNRTLTDEVSRQRGIGPDCVKRYGGAAAFAVDHS